MMHASKTRTLALLRRTKRKLEAAVSAVHCCFDGFVLSCKPHPCAMKSSHLPGKNLTIFKSRLPIHVSWRTSCLYGKGCGFKSFLMQKYISSVHCCFDGFVLSCKPYPGAMKSLHLESKSLTEYEGSLNYADGGTFKNTRYRKFACIY